MTFPELDTHHWRTARPYIVTLTDGDRMPAYPIHGKITDGALHFGVDCNEPMWLVHDGYIESPLITIYSNAQIINTTDVTAWETIL